MAPMMRFVGYVALGFGSSIAHISMSASAAEPVRQEAASPSQLSPLEVSQLQAKADAGDASAQTKLGKAYQDGNGVPQNDALAVKWFRKAADQGDARAENELGIRYRTGQGVNQNKEEAVRWYRKAAKHGSPEAMFNLGASFYNGEGVGSNEYSAYAWFLLAQEAGDKAANDAVRRTAADMSPKETADTLMDISEMYEKGEELPQSGAQSMSWLRKAAEKDSRAKVRLATRLLNGSDAPQNYGQALDLCRMAAKDYAPGQYCVGYFYRNGRGVNKDPAETIKWYQKAVAAGDPSAMLDLADMYSDGEGTKVNRAEAFMLLLRATRMGVIGAREKASALLNQLDQADVRAVEKKLHEQNLDPKKVFAAVRANFPSEISPRP